VEGERGEGTGSSGTGCTDGAQEGGAQEGGAQEAAVAADILPMYRWRRAGGGGGGGRVKNHAWEQNYLPPCRAAPAYTHMIVLNPRLHLAKASNTL
jgi:hypothetical protein